MKRKRAHKQDATEKRLLYENRTTEYAAGIGLDIGADAALTATPTTTRKHKKRTQCRCGSTTHLTSRHKECKYNKNNLLAMSLCGETKEGESVNSTAGEKSARIEEEEI